VSSAVSADMTIDKRKMDAILKAFDGNVSKAVRTIAFSVEGKAKIKCPVDTGALRSSIMVRTYESYGGLVEAIGRSGVRRGELPAPVDGATAYVGPTMEYGIYVELGTSRRRAQPYLVPAVRETEREIAGHFAGVVSDGR